MGYDIGFHAIDKKDIDDLSLYITGNLEEITHLKKSVVASKARFIANAWGLGLSQFINNKLDEERIRIKEQVENSKPGFLGKLIGKKTQEPNYQQIDSKSFAGEFESDLHIWGRPFFITDTENLDSLIKEYIKADESGAESLAKSQIGFLKNGLQEPVMPDIHEFPEDEVFIHNARWKIDLFKKAYSALSKNEKVKDDDGNEHNPSEIFQSDFILSLVESAALAQPSWMARGYVWPSLLLDEVGSKSDYFQTAKSLVNEEIINLNGIEYGNELTISDNYSIGAVVSPKELDKFKTDISKHSNAILQKAKNEDWEYDCKLVLQKISECVNYCINNNLYFVESSDIYSGSMGTIS